MSEPINMPLPKWERDLQTGANQGSELYAIEVSMLRVALDEIDRLRAERDQARAETIDLAYRAMGHAQQVEALQKQVADALTNFADLEWQLAELIALRKVRDALIRYRDDNTVLDLAGVDAALAAAKKGATP